MAQSFNFNRLIEVGSPVVQKYYQDTIFISSPAYLFYFRSVIAASVIFYGIPKRGRTGPLLPLVVQKLTIRNLLVWFGYT